MDSNQYSVCAAILISKLLPNFLTSCTTTGLDVTDWGLIFAKYRSIKDTLEFGDILFQFYKNILFHYLIWPHRNLTENVLQIPFYRWGNKSQERISRERWLQVTVKLVRVFLTSIISSCLLKKIHVTFLYYISVHKAFSLIISQIHLIGQHVLLALLFRASLGWACFLDWLTFTIRKHREKADTGQKSVSVKHTTAGSDTQEKWCGCKGSGWTVRTLWLNPRFTTCHLGQIRLSAFSFRRD